MPSSAVICSPWTRLCNGSDGVDPQRVHELLNSGLDDFLAFAQHVESYLIRCDT